MVGGASRFQETEDGPRIWEVNFEVPFQESCSMEVSESL